MPMETEMSALTVPRPVPSIIKGTYEPPPVAGEFVGLTFVMVGCASTALPKMRLRMRKNIARSRHARNAIEKHHCGQPFRVLARNIGTDSGRACTGTPTGNARECAVPVTAK